MKLLTLLSLFAASTAMADVCDFRTTGDIYDAVKAGEVKKLKTSRNHKKFTSQEKQMIKLSVNVESNGSYYENMAAALREFGDYRADGTLGANAGEIEYFLVDGEKIALVHYYPGDTEVGAIFGIKSADAVTYYATVGDGDIACED